ncbi:hypothetical protein D1BOALGB6SA_4587 [Olavius sp. associated proteobacterium Delta 1]|nr:hypothetical protein D1BOALGB6SA_4587 [Olavius sp. associated proteobacterium Delta 1]
MKTMKIPSTNYQISNKSHSPKFKNPKRIACSGTTRHHHRPPRVGEAIWLW